MWHMSSPSCSGGIFTVRLSHKHTQPEYSQIITNSHQLALVVVCVSRVRVQLNGKKKSHLPHTSHTTLATHRNANVSSRQVNRCELLRLASATRANKKCVSVAHRRDAAADTFFVFVVSTCTIRNVIFSYVAFATMLRVRISLLVRRWQENKKGFLTWRVSAGHIICLCNVIDGFANVNPSRRAPRVC